MYLATGFEVIKENLPIILPILVVELILLITALTHVLRHHTYRFGNKIMWVLIVVFLQIIGPVIYFAIGRGDE
ncbi:PLDc N-terminal domain-containing protein [Anaerosporobacter faecicola]|uniref:PLDc N-terminal domain-containing protein n=1 Tax=Anaerosporobacter faecicola TaxID=2718714 RepID=UPI001439E74F|nr:PLD nuclease N-terminal domain-containing protein [Anaerosporobacter faecicola]